MMDNSITQENPRKQVNIREILRNYFSFIGLLIVAIVFEIMTGGDLFESRNLVNIFNNFFSIGLGAMGVVFLMSLGELDLSVGAIAGLAAALAAYAARANLALILPAAIVAGILIGLLNGVIISKFKVESFIGTLAMSFIARGITTWLLNGSVGIPISQNFFDQNSIKIAAFVLSLVVLFLLFEFMPFGKCCRAIGSSSNAARQAGVRVEKTKILAFVISGLMCGLVGFFSLVRTCTASSQTGNAFEFDVLLAVLFGGMPLTGGWPV